MMESGPMDYLAVSIELEIAGLVLLILTVLVGIVTLTRYFARLETKNREDKLEEEKRRLEQTLQEEKRKSDDAYAGLQARFKDLSDQVDRAKSAGTEMLIKRLQVEDDLSAIMRGMRAGAGSVYVPFKSSGASEPQHLVFLSILPVTDQTNAIKRKPVPVESSLSGRCFRTGTAFVVSNAQRDPDHYQGADEVSGYMTLDMLNIPLRNQGELVGVLQLLNRQGGDRFEDADIPRVEPLASQLAMRVAEFLRDPAGLELLGIAVDPEGDYATVMFCDMTRSSRIFRELNTGAAIQHINEWLEMLCDVAFYYGATVDKYMGDGAIFRFNVPRPLKDHPIKAVQAAKEMVARFEKLKQGWIKFGEHVTDVYLRVGIAYGSVHQAVVGHPQYQYMTVFGKPVNVASNLCENAPRDRNAIIIDENLHERLGTNVDAEACPKEWLGKAADYIETAYQVRILR